MTAMLAPHWSDDMTDDLSWRNYQAGWDAGRAAGLSGDRPDLTGHGEPFTDGFADGWFEARQS